MNYLYYTFLFTSNAPILHVDSHESKPAMCILAIIDEGQKIPQFLILPTIPFMIKHCVA